MRLCAARIQVTVGALAECWEGSHRSITSFPVLIFIHCVLLLRCIVPFLLGGGTICVLIAAAFTATLGKGVRDVKASWKEERYIEESVRRWSI